MEVCAVSKPNFDAMSPRERYTYILSHRDDEEAFYAYVDKLHAEANWVEMPALQSLADLDQYPEFAESIRRGGEPQDYAH
jgi:hypothetical protein